MTRNPWILALACSAAFSLRVAADDPSPADKEDVWPAGEADAVPAAASAPSPQGPEQPYHPAPGGTPRQGVPVTEEYVDRLIKNLESKSVTEREYARNVLAALPPDALRKPLLRVLHDRSPGIRKYAAEALAQVRDNAVVRPLVSAAVEDKEGGVRDAAVDTLVTLAGREIAWAFLGEMSNGVPRFRINAFHALGLIRNPYAIGWLIRRTRYYAAGGGGPRCHIFIGEQITYVKDYDVEVATNAAAFDPIVGVANNGLVLDVQPIRTEEIYTVEERVALVDALRGLTGADYGIDTAAWTKWWDANKAHFTADFEAENEAQKKVAEADYVWRLGRKYEVAERFEDAIRQYRKLLARYPESRHKVEAGARLAELEASATVQNRIRLSRELEECKRLVSQAETYLMSGMAEKAIEPARKVVDAYPDTEWAAKARDILARAKGKPVAAGK